MFGSEDDVFDAESLDLHLANIFTVGRNKISR